MKVLIGCEYSGTVRDAFISRGHDAMSCDLLPTDKPGPHFQGDVFEAIKMKDWDLAIFHPPCTYLAGSGIHWNKRVPGREELTKESVEFVKALWECGIPRVCIENPIGVLSTRFRKPTQIIQPWQFGDPESKATCLWIRGMQPLEPTKFAEFTHYRCKCGNVFEESFGKYGCCEKAASPLWNNQTASGQNKLGPSPDRWKIRSTTYQGIADGMADQWGGAGNAGETQLKLF